MLVFFIGVTVVAGSLLILREHKLANKYRELIKLHRLNQVSAPHGPAWKIIYKENRQTKELIVPATTEAEAMLAATRSHNIRFDKILSLKQV